MNVTNFKKDGSVVKTWKTKVGVGWVGDDHACIANSYIHSLQVNPRRVGSIDVPICRAIEIKLLRTSINPCAVDRDTSAHTFDKRNLGWVDKVYGPDRKVDSCKLDVDGIRAFGCSDSDEAPFGTVRSILASVRVEIRKRAWKIDD